MNTDNLDDPERLSDIVYRIKKKRTLFLLYKETYKYFVDSLKKISQKGIALELGSGGGFLKEFDPSFITSDIIKYKNVDKIIDATNIPFENNKLKMICMLNTLHHIGDAESFFREAERCLTPGGRIIIVDQHSGPISRPILKYAHHEGYNDKAINWKFESKGPLSSANGALPWIIFQRDKKEFELKFSKLKILSYRPHTPLRYWLSGGLKKWNLLPISLYKTATYLDNILININSNLGTFVNIEVEKKC